MAWEITKEEVSKLRFGLQFARTLYYVFSRLCSSIFYLEDILGTQFSDEIAYYVFDNVKDLVLPVMANYSKEDINSLLNKPQFRDLQKYYEKIMELYKESRKVKPKPVVKHIEHIPVPVQPPRAYAVPVRIVREHPHVRRVVLASALIILFLFAVIFFNIMPSIPEKLAEAFTFDSKVFIQKVFSYVNVERVNRGLSPLKWNTALYAAAKHHAEWIAETGLYQHVEDHPKYREPWDRALAYGFRSTYVGENLHQTYCILCSEEDLAKGTVKTWMESRGHRENILNPTFKYAAVAVAKKGTTIYVVLLLAR